MCMTSHRLPTAVIGSGGGKNPKTPPHDFNERLLPDRHEPG